MTTATETETTYSPRVTRDGDDFMAEVAVWSDSPVPEYIFVGYFSTHAAAYEAACEESTDYAKRAAADAALEALDAEIETCCESCGLPLAIEDAFLADALNVCGGCYGSADSRRVYREALAQQGAAEDAARDAAYLAQWQRQQEDAARADDAEPIRSAAAEDRYNRGGW